MSSNGQDSTLVTSKPQFKSEHGLSALQQAINELSATWLGHDGVIAVCDEVRGHETVIVVMVTDNRGTGVPTSCNGYRVVVEDTKHSTAEPVKSVRKRTAFNLSKFLEFQAKAGCAITQEAATALWKEVMPSLTPAQKDDILDAWGEVSKGDCRPVIDTLYGGHKCSLDYVCDKIHAAHIKSQDFIG